VANPVGPSRWELLKRAAPSLDVKLQLLDVRKPEDLEHAFAAAIAQTANALIVANDTVTIANRRQVAELAAKHRLPAMYASREFVDVGGLIGGPVSYPDLYRRAATFVDKIFKGRQTGRPTDRAANQVRAGDESQDLESCRADGSGIIPPACRRGDRMSNCDVVAGGSLIDWPRQGWRFALPRCARLRP